MDAVADAKNLPSRDNPPRETADVSKPGNYPLPLHKQELGATDDAEQPTMDPLNEESSSAFDEIGSVPFGLHLTIPKTGHTRKPKCELTRSDTYFFNFFFFGFAPALSAHSYSPCH